MISPETFCPVDQEAVTLPSGSSVVKPTKNNIKQKCCGVYVGTGGTVALTLIGGDPGDSSGPAETSGPISYVNVANGQTILGQIASITGTGTTTASNLILLYLGL